MAESFVERPNLPEGIVKCVIIGEGHAQELGRALLPFGVRVLTCPKNPYVDERLSSHADLSIIHLGGKGLLASAAVCRPPFIQELEAMGFEVLVSMAAQGQEYPQDCALCALILGDRLFHNFRFSDKLLPGEGAYRQIHVNQGYTKCAVCPVGDSAAITSDLGVAKQLSESGIDVLTVGAEGLVLSGFANGFFGGSAFKLSAETLAFTGTLERCRDKAKIEEFLRKHGIEPVYLTQKPVFDIGSVIPVTYSTSGSRCP